LAKTTAIRAMAANSESALSNFILAESIFDDVVTDCKLIVAQNY